MMMNQQSGLGILPKNRRRTHGQDGRATTGFTLMELLLAVGVCAVVLAAVNAVFFSAVRLRERTVTAVDNALPRERMLTIVRRDLQGMMLTPSTNRVMGGTFRVGDFNSYGLSQNANIELYTTTGTLHETEPWAEVQRVAYSLHDPGDRTQSGKNLVRSVTRNLLATIIPTPQEEILLGNCATLSFECFDGSQWRTDWDTTMNDSNLPTAVRMKLTLNGPHGVVEQNQQPIELLVPIDLQTTTNQTATGET